MATQFARVKRAENGRLAVHLRHADGREGSSTFWIGPGESRFGVPFEKWERHIGETIDLSTWEGTGEGMIGGPTRTRVAALIYDGPLACVMWPWTDPEEIRKEVERLQEWLADDRYEIFPAVEEQIRGYIAEGLKFLNDREQSQEDPGPHPGRR